MDSSTKTTATTTWLCLIAAIFFFLQPVPALSALVGDACTEGNTVPPFLSSGADPNLLLILDNSGSMLDMAYVETVGECVDNAFNFEQDGTYNPNKIYTGLYDPDKWYKWVDGVPQWESGMTYTAGDYVYSEGVFYEAVSVNGVSVGFQIIDDFGVDWQRIHEIMPWTQGEVYDPQSFVQYDQQLYYTVAGGTALDTDLTDGLSISGDTGVIWIAYDSTMDANAHVDGDIVSYQGMLFYADSTTTTGRGTRLDEGHFEEVTYTTSAGAATDFSAMAGDAYSQDNLYIKIVNVDVDDGAGGIISVQSRATAFAASGRLLNWATASKFDIEKKILTGGKYDTEEQSLISQSRGCSSHGFVKEVPILFKNGVAVTQTITFSVNGTSEDNWIDTLDDTTRISILGISDGFIDSAREIACQTVIAEVAKGDQANQGIIRTNATVCLDYTGTNNVMAESNAAYNHSIHACWQSVNSHYDSPSDFGNVSEIYNACAHIYDNGVAPASIDPSNSGYMCYGIYNDTLPDALFLATDTTGTGSLRTGYIGRCWKTGDLAPGCETVPCVYGAPVNPGDDDYVDATDPSIYHRCLSDNNLYSCDNYNTGRDECKSVWVLDVQDDGVVELPIDITCDETAAAAAGGWNADNPPGINDIEGCVQSALWDYCGNLTVPEVIDPSDQIFNSGDTWGMPGAMVDAGLANMFGNDHALIVMKGYIQQTTAPTGILHQVAPNLRLGAMAFNDNGAATECLSVDVNDNIVEYCPDGNRDGAQLISPIMGGMEVTDPKDAADPDDDIYHVDDLTVAINDIRATAWTPLAEALYNAIGYFGQHETRRLNDTDFVIGTDFPTWDSTHEYNPGDTVSYSGNYYEWAGTTLVHNHNPSSCSRWHLITPEIAPDPIQYWCQSNNILLISEGASTADINTQVTDFVKNDAYEDISAVPDVDNEAECLAADDTSLLYGSTYLDDLTYYAQNADVSDLYKTTIGHPGQLQNSDGSWNDKQNISTFIVTTGVLRDNNNTTDECNPKTIMTNAAANGGTTLLQGEDPSQLEDNLKDALADIMNRASAGSAASVISSSRTGEGAAYQAIFWPKVPRGVGEDDLSWIGDVHSLYIGTEGWMMDDYSGGTTTVENATGRLWSADANGNGRLDAGEGSGCLAGDRRIFFYFDETDQITKICFNDSVRNGLCVNDPTNPLCPLICATDTTDPACANPVCDPSQTEYCGTFAEPVSIKDFQHYLWSAEQQLESVTVIDENRPVLAGGRWDWSEMSSNIKKRYIFTWNDLNNDGIVDQATEILGLDNNTNWGALNHVADPANITHDILDDFNVADATAMGELVNWIRGADDIYEYASTDADGSGTIDPINDFVTALDDINNNGKQDYVYRCRRFPDCDPTDPTNNPEWRLGDIIHSTPTLVAQPAEGYHTIYRDPSYAWFVKKYRLRRQMVYFGANDGMMHAVNAGFFHDGTKSFCRQVNVNYDPTATGPPNNNACLNTGPEVGDELWAYIPYNLAPHMKCLSDPGYTHKYFVDQKPRLMDVQIFTQEAACATDVNDTACIHPYGWGTILIGAMRFGGAPVDANADPAVDDRRFISSYFVLDVTDPERPPELLGEMTMTRDTTTGDPNFADLAYTTPIPAGVVMRDTSGRTLWYLVFGNGPTTLKGENNQQGKVAVLPLSWLKGDISWDTSGTLPKPDSYGTKKPFRIPDAAPTIASGEGGIFLIPADGTSASFIGDLINADYDLENQSSVDLGAFYMSDSLYFGTTDGTGFANYLATDPLYEPLFPDAKHWDGGGRLYRLVTRQMSGSLQVTSLPHEWYLSRLMDAKAPITAAPALGWDGANYWVYFGTGRFFDKDDKTDKDPNYFFGVKEPMTNLGDCTLAHDMTWAEILFDVTASPLPALSPGFTPGSRGLFRADHVLVVEKSDASLGHTTQKKPYVYCEDGSTSDECQLPSMGLTTLTQVPPDDGRDYYAYSDMLDYIVGDCAAGADTTKMGIDGWYRQFRDPRERNIGQSTLLGGLTTFTTYQPSSDLCTAEGQSFLYGVHFQTGTAWYEDVIGVYEVNSRTIVRDKLGLGRGLTQTPNIHVGTGEFEATAIVQTSTGEIIEIGQKNLPIPPMKAGKTGWTDQCK